MGVHYPYIQNKDIFRELHPTFRPRDSTLHHLYILNKETYRELHPVSEQVKWDYAQCLHTEWDTSKNDTQLREQKKFYDSSSVLTE